jgi:hypothetical protein
MPSQVDHGYLQSVLGVQEGHARNLIPQLRVVGLTDNDGRPTSRANAWRSDEEYPNVCREILENVYPQALRDAVPPSEPDRGTAARWFMRELGLGENAAGKMAAFYVLLCEADPSKAERTSNRAEPTPQRRTVSKPTQPSPPAQPTTGASSQTAAASQPPAREPVPSLHIDVQVHIPSDASAEQIDAIFSSMAKHLYKRS